jgi:hypothetical protein
VFIKGGIFDAAISDANVMGSISEANTTIVVSAIL